MLKSGNLNSQRFTVSVDCISVIAPTVVRNAGVNADLQCEGEFNFLSFDDKVRKDLTKHGASLLATSGPIELGSVVDVPFGVVVDVDISSKLALPILNDGSVGHTDSGNDLPADQFLAFDDSADTNATFTVKQSSSVSKFHKTSLAVTDMSANSENTQNGQPRTKQAERPGARREQVPTPKGKICSELRRNTETLAEMTGGHVCADYSTHHGLTDCNTDYFFWRPHRDRNFVPIGGERQSVNQDAVVKLIGWAGNLTSSGPQFSGVLIA